MRVVQRDADLLALVLEAVHLADAVHRAERGSAIRPGLQHRADPAGRQAGEGRIMIGGEADHLAPAGPRAPGGQRILARQRGTGPVGHIAAGCPAQRGKTVLEHHDVVVGSGYLGLPTGP
jgi:hypothetical protein